MGADGGVVYVPLKHPTAERWDRIRELLRPFWQFLDDSGLSYPAEEGNAKWHEKNSIGGPDFLLGYYGTDRCDNFELGDLPDLVEPFEDWRGNLYCLTFDELDLECRTSLTPPTGTYHEHVLRRLWYEHFHYTSREEVLTKLGSLATMKIEDWCREVDSILCLGRIAHEETWT